MALNLPVEYESLAQDIRRKVLACVDENDWNCIKTLQKESLTIYSKQSTEFNGKIFKGEGLIEASPEDCFKHCNPKPELSRSKWDKSIKALEIVKTIKLDDWPEAYLLRTMTHSAVMGLISGRDFVDLIVNVNDDTLVGTFAQSVDQNICPPSKEYVRGINHYCAILSTRVPGEPNRTKLVYIAHADIGGQIPLKVVESAVPSAIVTFFSGLKEELGLKD